MLGTTYSQIAADSRTMHKSQGFGSTSQIGQGNDFIELIKGPTFKNHPFEDISSRWEQLPNGNRIIGAIDKALAGFDFTFPENNLENLLEIKKLLNGQDSDAMWLGEKKVFLDKLILEILGVKAEFIVRKEIGYPGETIIAELIFNNPAGIPLTVRSFEGKVFNQNINKEAKDNIPVSQALKSISPELSCIPPLVGRTIDGTVFEFRFV